MEDAGAIRISEQGNSKMSEEPKDREKKTYEPPQLSIISLRPGEAVLGHCKSMNTSGPVPTCSALGGCMFVGS